MSFIFVFFLASPSVLAQTATPSSVKQGSPSATTSVMLIKVLNTLMARFEAGVSRAEKISQRIASRLSKIRSNQTVASDKLNVFETRQKTFAGKLGQLRGDLSQLSMTAKTFSTSSSSPKDYQAFKNQALLLTKNLKDIYKLEQELVSDLKRVASVTAVPTKGVAPTP